MRVLFARASDLVQSLIEARDQRRLTALQQRYQKVAFLVVDELGSVPFERAGGELLFNLLASDTNAARLLSQPIWHSRSG